MAQYRKIAMALLRECVGLSARRECWCRFKKAILVRARPRMQPFLAMGHPHHELALAALERSQLRYPGKVGSSVMSRIRSPHIGHTGLSSSVLCDVVII
jgi:hypothetical protein